MTLCYIPTAIMSELGWWKEVTIKHLKTSRLQHLLSPTSLLVSSQDFGITCFSSASFHHFTVLLHSPSLLCLKPGPPGGANPSLLLGPTTCRSWPCPPACRLCWGCCCLSRCPWPHEGHSLAGLRLRGGGLWRRLLPSCLAMNCVPRCASAQLLR